MARAIILGLLDRQCRLSGWSRQRFRRMCEQQATHTGMAQQLLQLARCRLYKPAYGLPDLERIQRALDLEMGRGAVRLVVFDQEAAFQVMWKGPDRAEFNLCLVYHARHYDYVVRAEQLLKVIHSLYLFSLCLTYRHVPIVWIVRAGSPIGHIPRDVAQCAISASDLGWINRAERHRVSSG